ncbi:MAG: bifunctional phosphoribosylaminoimidazolecarboxamide formyltransferase/IMP cyclohydrolase [Candidatus Peribacteraceae bacterium]|nr:bifunctional phosphoribosylaminoimidazolecarboxamide formyltransferase/IMP cyclohydrolase [Candidatus Peribacteraceae bacterium]MDD5074877.1 bifunctional phosphoribosylaminoimidazolecarboxamide formyltransferase/IMP cyclohydrolase [Candidatus Peribacteraceae bacterium]
MHRLALLSVSDKRGIEEFARGLTKHGYEIISTGGTQRALEKAKIKVTPIEEFTKFPECFGGRLKTLHPLVFGGILFRRDEKDHVEQAQKLGIRPIDLVCVNLYPFEETAAKPGVTREEMIEQIDIGGPSLLRAAAKNAESVTVLCDPDDYPRVLAEFELKKETSPELKTELAEKVFLHTAAYDCAITRTLSGGRHTGVLLTNKMLMRYGENPHQWGAFYELYKNPPDWLVLQEEKQMSYLNILDADGAWNLVCEFGEPTAACIKHANPSGVASHKDIAEAFQRAYDADRLSAYGVIIALNRTCTRTVIEKIIEQKIFVEIIIAPGYEPVALELLKSKPKIRVIENHCIKPGAEVVSFRSALGGMLIQNLDTRIVTEKDLTCVTDIKPTKEQIRDLLFAWKVVKNAKSNAIVFARDAVSIGIGAGQTSRVDSTIIAARRAGERARGAAMASDAFFPFPDSVEEAAKHGIGAIIQPGGSVRDAEVIAKANELKIPMIFTGVRGFKH